MDDQKIEKLKTFPKERKSYFNKFLCSVIFATVFRLALIVIIVLAIFKIKEIQNPYKEISKANCSDDLTNGKINTYYD